MDREIIQDHDLTGAEPRSQDLLDICLKRGSISRSMMRKNVTVLTKEVQI